jgi:hypothetical protein
MNVFYARKYQDILTGDAISPQTIDKENFNMAYLCDYRHVGIFVSFLR